MSALVGVGPYPHPPPPPECRPYNRKAVAAAAQVRGLIMRLLPGLDIEHVGSTAVPGCEGKGYIDLLIPYAPDQLERIRESLQLLGFQHQRAGHPFPEDRPMRTGAVVYEGETFLVHIHVVPASSPEVDHMRRFRDRLRADPALAAAYVRRKHEILDSGVKDSRDYSEAKTDFIAHALAGTQTE